MAADDVGGWDLIVAEQEKRLQAYREIQRIIRETPGVEDDLRKALGVDASPVSKAGEPAPLGANSREVTAVAHADAGLGHFEIVRRFLESKGNQPQSAPQIITGTGLKRVQVSTVLYKAKKGAFEQIRLEGSKRPLWRLREHCESSGTEQASGNNSRATGNRTDRIPDLRLKNGGRFKQLRDFLRQHGPMHRKEILAQSGLPAGTIAMLLKKDKFAKDQQGRWWAPQQPGEDAKQGGEQTAPR